LYVLSKENKNIKDVIAQEINKNISHEHTRFMYIKVEKITEKLSLIYIYGTEYSVYQKTKEVFEKYKEPWPPWIAFPDMFQGCPRWNQGYQEHYCVNYWIPYWHSMDMEGKNAYYVKYSAPQEWIDWLTEYEKCF
jgi:hypothetical protein